MAERLRVLNATRGTLLASDARRAAGPVTRMIGLLGRAALGPGEGLHLRPCRSVHTWFMRFAVDLLYLDGEQHVVKTVPALRPFRLSWGGRRARSALELPVGTIAATRTAVGDRVAFQRWGGGDQSQS
jgi:uncharacterized membrane protein (UPF0127 family)